jgi:hypothetical protein
MVCNVAGAKRPASDAEGSGTPAKKAKPATVVTQSGEVAPKGTVMRRARGSIHTDKPNTSSYCSLLFSFFSRKGATGNCAFFFVLEKV